MQTPQFGGFQPSGKAKIAQSMGFQGPMEQFDKFLQDNPDKQSEMMRYEDFARKMVSGGYVAKMQEGGDAPKKDPTIADVTIGRVTQPALPAGAITTAYGVPTDETQTIAEGTGSVGDMPQPAPTAKATTTQEATTQVTPTPVPVPTPVTVPVVGSKDNVPSPACVAACCCAACSNAPTPATPGANLLVSSGVST